MAKGHFTVTLPPFPLPLLGYELDVELGLIRHPFFFSLLQILNQLIAERWAREGLRE